jgi:hypothetical protein
MTPCNDASSSPSLHLDRGLAAGGERDAAARDHKMRTEIYFRKRAMFYMMAGNIFLLNNTGNQPMPV